MAVCCCGPFLKGDAAFPNLLKISEFRLSFPAPAKNLVCLNLFAGKGKNSRKSALHYQRFASAISEPPGLFLAALCAADVMILGKPTHDVNNKIKKTFGAVYERNACAISLL